MCLESAANVVFFICCEQPLTVDESCYNKKVKWIFHLHLIGDMYMCWISFDNSCWKLCRVVDSCYKKKFIKFSSTPKGNFCAKFRKRHISEKKRGSLNKSSIYRKGKTIYKKDNFILKANFIEINDIFTLKAKTI